MSDVTLDLAIFERYAKTWQPDEIIFLEYEFGDKFYLIQHGRVKLSKVINNIEKTIDILEPGDLFGEMAILEQQPRSASAIAVDEVKMLEFTKENFEMLITKNPALGIKLIKIFAKRIYDAKRRLMILQLEEPEYRIADCFLVFAEHQNVPRELYRQEQEFSSSPKDVASWCGLPPNAVTKVFNDWQRSGKIKVYEKKILVKNLNEYQRMIDSKRKEQH